MLTRFKDELSPPPPKYRLHPERSCQNHTLEKADSWDSTPLNRPQKSLADKSRSNAYKSWDKQVGKLIESCSCKQNKTSLRFWLVLIYGLHNKVGVLTLIPHEIPQTAKKIGIQRKRKKFAKTLRINRCRINSMNMIHKSKNFNFWSCGKFRKICKLYFR